MNLWIIRSVIPQIELNRWKSAFDSTWNNAELHTGDVSGVFSIIAPFCDMAKRYGFEKTWIDAFFASMEQDLEPRYYETWEELMEYVFGSAEVIGLMMTRLMGTPTTHDMGARALGASMQLINFLRDLYEDRGRERLYIPLEELTKHELTSVTLWAENTLHEKKISLIQEYIQRIDTLQATAETSFAYLPKGCLIPVRLASDAYKHTLQKIRRDPLLALRGAPKNHAGDILLVAASTLFSESIHAIQGKISA